MRASFCFAAAIAFFVLVPSASLRAQGPPPQGSTRALPSEAIPAEPAGHEATLVFFNRPIVVLRARVLGRTPDERVVSAWHVLEELTDNGSTRPVEWRSFNDAALITVASRSVLALTSADIDELAGESIAEVARQTVSRLQQALDEAAEARAPRALLRSAVLAALALAIGAILLLAIGRARRIAAAKLVAIAETSLERSGIADRDSLRASRLLEFERGIVATVAVAAELVVVYTTVTFVLRRFPYTRPWGESMRVFLVNTVEQLGLAIVNGLPGLFSAAVILVLARFLIRLLGFWFSAIEHGRINARWIYPETALPTRRLVSALVWIFAVVVAYPYLPGSQSEGFKGISVFLGLMLTFGSSGLVNQIMSGFMVTYSRALRVGDFVRMGDVEGTVTHLGVLSTKVRTLLNEEVTIPNAVVVSQTTTDYTRLADTAGVFTPTSVTIGYDAPWRQVQSLLLSAAARTPGVRRDPQPIVLQSALQDFYVKYTLWVCLERQESRLVTLHQLHAHIQDLFNEHGVQIMSPNYVTDPAAPKIVPKENWFGAPVRAGASKDVSLT